MAAQKKKTGKKNKTKSGSRIQAESDVPFFAMLGGWFLFGVGGVLLLGCVSSVYSGTEGNWLGPYLGKMLPDLFSILFGKLPVIAFTLSLMLWGLFAALKSVRARIMSFAVGMTLLTLDLSCLLSLKTYGAAQLSRDVMMLNGGVIGQFFCQNVAIPVFGTASCIAPLLILLVILALILVLSFGLRPRHFHFLAQGMRYVAGLFHKKQPEDEPVEAEVVEKASPKRRGITMIDDETIFNEPGGYKIKQRGELRPFSARKNWMDSPDMPVASPRSLAADSEETVMPGMPADARTLASARTVVPSPSAVPSVSSSETLAVRETPSFAGEDPEIARLEQELAANEGKMNSLEIMQIKERIAALRRARDLINWEKEHHGRLVVKGAVRGDSPETAARMEVADRTVVAGSGPASVASDADATINAGDAVAAADPTMAPAKPAGLEESDDETFIPQIVSSDEVERDPTYVPPSCIGTSGGPVASVGSPSAGIPQPDPTVHYDEYRIPSVCEILEEHEPQPADYTEDELNAIGRMLEEKLENFKVKGKVVGCETGPVITRFEVEPGPGVKVSQFSSLQDDLAMALRAISIRILTPIPGKGAVGIEIPNRKSQIIYGRDIFESEAFKPSPEKIMVALGKDISGEPFAMDLAKAPHLMIAGQTGSGKSVCINALMASILFSKTPDELRMILVDPKAVELKMYENIPHLLAPVITKPELAIQALEWLCYEMDRRTEVLAAAKVRNIGGFNMKFEAGELPEEVPEEDRGHRMAFIVVIIDEMADLMMTGGKEIEKSVSRLAAKARAVGIHLVLATQRPSVKVITGNIKANMPTRISFKVAGQVDARTIMDHAGAEKLLGRGDMLFKAVNAPDPVRVHGAFLSDEEAEKLADACSNQNVCYPQLESFDVEGEGGDDEDGEAGGAMGEKLDKLLFDVAEWAIEVGNGVSTSAVQRHFSVGYSRAGKIVDQLYGLGVCGRSTGNSKPRALLIGMDELLQMLRSGRFG